MLCKVVVQAEEAQPIAWRQIGSPKPQSARAAHAAPLLETSEIERRIAEIRAAGQVEAAQSKQKAFDDGLRQGRAEAAGAITEGAEKLGRTLAELASFKRKLRADAEREVVKLSVAIARRILNRELSTDPDALQGVVHAALCRLQARETWQVRVGTQAFETVRSYVEDAGLATTIKVIADPALHEGDLLIDTPSGELDASVNTQLHEIERGFAERLALR